MKAINYFEPIKEEDESGAKLRKIILYVSLAGILLGFVLLSVSPFIRSPGLAMFMVFAELPISVLILIVGLCMKPKINLLYLNGEKYDKIVLEMLEWRMSNPMLYLGLDESEVMEIKPITFEGYKFSSGCRARKNNRDSRWRSDIYEKAYIYFTQNEVHMYKATLNSVNETLSESTEVLFYEDIVSVSTDTETVAVKDGVSLDYRSFNLRSRGGNSFSVALYSDSDDTQRSINAMRALIKEKKTK